MRVLLTRLALVLACAAGVALVAPASAGADEFGIGNYSENDYENDWYYDSYDAAGAEAYDYDYDEGWFDNEYYDGYYDDDNADNDWFFDSYDDPGDEGLFDI